MNKLEFEITSLKHSTVIIVTLTALPHYNIQKNIWPLQRERFAHKKYLKWNTRANVRTSKMGFKVPSFVSGKCFAVFFLQHREIVGVISDQMCRE